MLLKKGQRLLMIGDSVTDAGRTYPVGQGLGGMGSGYPALVRALLESSYPETPIHVMNVGISGNTVRDLNTRWQCDVIDLTPDWVSVMIGINDVWRQYDSPTMPAIHVYLPEYERTLRALVDRTMPITQGMVLLTPYYMEPNKNDPMRKTMDAYGAAVKKIAEATGALFVDTQALFDHLFAHTYPATVAWDRIHPNMTGHMLLARALLKALGAQRC